MCKPSVQPTRGQGLIDGVDITEVSSEELQEIRRHKLGMVFQHFALFPHRTILENVEYGLEIQGVSKKREETVLKALNQVGLGEWGSYKPENLSGGMQNELLDLQFRLHKTIVFITHDLDEALRIGDRIAILNNEGKIVQIDLVNG